MHRKEHGACNFYCLMERDELSQAVTSTVCEGPLLSLLLSYTDLGLSLYFGSVTKFA